MQNAANLPKINAERSKFAPNQCRTQQICPKSMQNAANWFKINAERSKLTQNQCITQQNGTDSMQNAAKRPRFNAERSYSRVWAHTLENEPQIDAERIKLQQNQCRTQQINPKPMQNAAKCSKINAGRSKLTPNVEIYAERRKFAPNRGRTQQICTKSMHNAANLPQITLRQKMRSSGIMLASGIMKLIL